MGSLIEQSWVDIVLLYTKRGTSCIATALKRAQLKRRLTNEIDKDKVDHAIESTKR